MSRRSEPMGFKTRKLIEEKGDPSRVLVIPDPQIRDKVPLDHMKWVARYANAKRPGRVICLGDLFDFPSISRWDRGKIQSEGRRIWRDIHAARCGVEMLEEELEYQPDKTLIMGNHEDRVRRLIEEFPWFDGLLPRSFSADGVPHEPGEMMKHFGWKVIPFLKPLRVAGVVFAHYFANPRSGRPIGGTAHNLLNKIGESFVQGHRQELDMAVRDTPSGRRIRGLIAGAFYQHNEPYAGFQGNNHWRGCILMTEVRSGWYNMVEVSMEFLKRRFR